MTVLLEYIDLNKYCIGGYFHGKLYSRFADYLVKKVIFVEENFAYTQDRALVMFLYDDFNLSLISSCKKQRANMRFN